MSIYSRDVADRLERAADRMANAGFLDEERQYRNAAASIRAGLSPAQTEELERSLLIDPQPSTLHRVSALAASGEYDSTGESGDESGSAAPDHTSDSGIGEANANQLLSTAFSPGLSNPYSSFEAGWTTGPQEFDAYSAVPGGSAVNSFTALQNGDPFTLELADNTTANPYTTGQNVAPDTGSQNTESFTGGGAPTDSPSPTPSGWDPLHNGGRPASILADPNLLAQNDVAPRNPAATDASVGLTNVEITADATSVPGPAPGVQPDRVEKNGVTYAHWTAILGGTTYDVYLNDSVLPGKVLLVPADEQLPVSTSATFLPQPAPALGPATPWQQPSQAQPTSGRVIAPPPPVGTPDNRLYVPEGFIWQNYKWAFGQAFGNNDNSVWARFGFGALATLSAPLAGAEEYIARPLANTPFFVENEFIGAGEHIGRAYLWTQQDEYGEALAEGLESIAHSALGFDVAASAVQPAAEALAEAAPAIRRQGSRLWADEHGSVDFGGGEGAGGSAKTPRRVSGASAATINLTREFSAADQAAIDAARKAYFVDKELPTIAGTAGHEAAGAAPHGIDFVRHGELAEMARQEAGLAAERLGAFQQELKLHFVPWIDQRALDQAAAQSLEYTLEYQAKWGLVPIRSVKHIWISPTDAVMAVIH